MSNRFFQRGALREGIPKRSLGTRKVQIMPVLNIIMTSYTIQLPEPMVHKLEKKGISYQFLSDLVMKWVQDWLENKPSLVEASFDWQTWLVQIQQLSAQIQQRRQNQPINVDELLTMTRQDLESKYDELFSH